MRTYVSTLGFHETRVTRPVLRHGLDEGDVVVLLRPATEADEGRGSDAVAHVEDMVDEISPDASVVIERVDHSDFETAVLECSDVLRAADGELIVNFGGGAREIFLPFTFATVAHADLVDMALQYTDIEQQVREWRVPNLTANVSEKVWPTLVTIADHDEEVSIPDITAQSEASKSTVTRHVQELAETELVDTRTAGNTKFARATTAGRLLLRQRET
ncbi:MAG: CRISPR-associated CARF protein Csa3 [Halorhabdus sp.]